MFIFPSVIGKYFENKKTTKVVIVTIKIKDQIVGSKKGETMRFMYGCIISINNECLPKNDINEGKYLQISIIATLPNIELTSHKIQG